MGHFAKVNNGIVERVIAAELEFFDKFVDTSPGTWIQTSYNTYGGIHRTGGTPLRKNYAGIGFTYNSILDAFIPPKPFSSWTLDETTCLWKPPVEMPNEGGPYYWDDATASWVAYPKP